MKIRYLLVAAILLCGADAPPVERELSWTQDQRTQLQSWLNVAPQEGLNLDRDATPVTDDTFATATALCLARALLLGTASAEQRAGWKIPQGDDAIDLRGQLAAALTRNDLNGFFRSLRPRNPQYEVLHQALLVETNPGKRTTLIRNLERWRWLPLDMSQRYLLVNVPGFEVDLWENGRETGSWRVIVGKPKTPTPVFSATVTGVTVNPWWDVPPSIVAESVGRLTRMRPAEARRRGYVWGGGRWRQRPGPGNALGQMKLAMPNPYNVYLHDTPSKPLFEEPNRAFSHGCVRVDKALDLAAFLLGRPVDAEVADGSTVTLPLAEPLPVYIAYFTADASATGGVEYHADIYHRDARMGDSSNPMPKCPA